MDRSEIYVITSIYKFPFFMYLDLYIYTYILIYTYIHAIDAIIRYLNYSTWFVKIAKLLTKFTKIQKYFSVSFLNILCDLIFTHIRYLPYSANIKTNIWKAFLNLIKTLFLKLSKLCKISNKNTVKVSHRYMSSILSVILGHNKKSIKSNCYNARQIVIISFILW